MERRYAFIAHSSKDKPFVLRLVETLKAENVWVDMWDMDLGENLINSIEKGIEGSSEFIVVLSENSAQSKWVNYELNMALTRWLEDENFRIICVRIDDSVVPRRLKPFLYVVDTPDHPDMAISKIEDFLKRKAEIPAQRVVPFRRKFIDRNKEVGIIEDFISDDRIRVIIVSGLYGIGKTDLVEETIRRVWIRANVCKFNLTHAHSGSRLALDLCAAASIDLPQDGTDMELIKKSMILATHTLISKGNVLIFDDFQNVLNEDGIPNDDFVNILKHVSKLEISSHVPVFVLSTRQPQMSELPIDNIGVLKLRGMENKYLETLLEQQLSRIAIEGSQPLKNVPKLAEKLYGYPLAARLAAPLLQKYSPDYLVRNIAHITDLRIDLAKSLLTRVHLNDSQSALLQVLAFFSGPLTTNQLMEALEFPPEEITQAIDTVVSYNLVELEEASIKLHGLLGDYYWRQVSTSATFRQVTKKLAKLAKKYLRNARKGSREYVFWLSNACRMLFLSGKLSEALQLRRDLSGELRASAFDIYHRREYELALKYCEEYLKADPSNFDVRLLKSRCLSRLERYEAAKATLRELYNQRATPSVMHAMGRVFLEEGEYHDAIEWFKKALDARKDHLPSLRDIGEALMALRNFNDARGYLEKALDSDPMNPFVLSLYADLLATTGKIEKAVIMMKRAVELEPQKASFLHRLGRLYERQSFLKKDYEQEQRLLLEAQNLFKTAFQNDASFHEARLSFISIAIDLGNLDIAKKEIENLRSMVHGKARRVLKAIEAKYCLATDDLKKAGEIAYALLRKQRDVTILGLCAKIEMKQAQKSQASGMTVMSDSQIEKARKLVEEGLQKDPHNEALAHHLEELKTFISSNN